MPSENNGQLVGIQDTILKTLSRIRTTARGRKGTELPSAEFSNAINAVGEQFVDSLLQVERMGEWWLDESGQWQTCAIKRVGQRAPCSFLRGDSAEWAWFPQTASRLADPMTGPDHVVHVVVPTLKLSSHVALEQKLRFGTRRDAFADSSTYLKHLLAGLEYPRPSKKEFQIGSYCDGLLESAKALLCKTKGDGSLSYSGSVPHVCFVSVCTPPNRIVVADKLGNQKVQCDSVGFLSPCIQEDSFAVDCPALSIVQRAKVRLWIGLDSLLEKCDAEEVDAAWNKAIESLSQSIRNPQWRSDLRRSAEPTSDPDFG